MSLRQGFNLYYDLFGAAGLAIVARSRLSGRNVEVAVSVPDVRHPVHLRIRSTDVGMCNEILIKRQYDYEFRANPEVIIDAGANIGLTSIFYANKYPDARIIAIEPEESNYRMLLKNTSAYPAVETVNAALWNENCEVDLLDPKQGHSAFRTKDKSEFGPVDHKRVPGITLDKLISDLGIRNIGLLKIDIEGAEIEVFKDPTRWIDRIGIIAIELHDWLRPGCDHSVSQALRDFGLRWRSGETTYFAKAGFASQINSNGLRGSPRSIESKFPLKILSIV